MKWFILFSVASTLLLVAFATLGGNCISKANDCTIICPRVGHLDLHNLLTENGGDLRKYYLPDSGEELSIPQCVQSESKSSVVLDWSIDVEGDNPYLFVDFVYAEDVTEPVRVLFHCSDDPYVKSVSGTVVIGSSETCSLLSEFTKRKNRFDAEVYNFCYNNLYNSIDFYTNYNYNPYSISNPYGSSGSYDEEYYSFSYSSYSNHYYYSNPSYITASYNSYSIICSGTEAMAFSGSTLAIVELNQLKLYYYVPNQALYQVASYPLPQREGYSSIEFASAAVNGSTIVVGFYDCVFTFTYEGGQLVQSSPLIRGRYKSWFGFAVALSGDTLMVSQISTDELFVYFWSTSGWSLTQTLTGTSSAWFGYSLAMSGDLALVGAPAANTVHAYFCSAGSWEYSTEFTTPQEDGHFFGGYMTMDGDVAVIANNYMQYIYKYVSPSWNYQNPVHPVGSIDFLGLSDNWLLFVESYYYLYAYSLSSPSIVQLTPTVRPSAASVPTPSVEPTVRPSGVPVYSPTTSPSAASVPTPSVEPTVRPSSVPVYSPTARPTHASLDSSQSDSINTSVIIAAAAGAGGALILLILISVLFYCWFFRKNTVPVEVSSGLELAPQSSPTLQPSYIPVPHFQSSSNYVPVVQASVVSVSAEKVEV